MAPLRPITEALSDSRRKEGAFSHREKSLPSNNKGEIHEIGRGSQLDGIRGNIEWPSEGTEEFFRDLLRSRN